MSASADMTMAAVKMVLSLGLVLGILWLTYRWMRRGAGTGGGILKNRLISVLANHYLGAKKSIAMVEVPGSVLVLGVSADRINLLTKIEDPALIAEMHKKEDRKNVLSFREQLQRITRSMSDNGKTPETVE